MMEPRLLMEMVPLYGIFAESDLPEAREVAAQLDLSIRMMRVLQSAMDVRGPAARPMVRMMQQQ
jgi:hypothetical protein